MDICRDIEVDNQGFLYFCGEFQDTVDFDPGPGVTTLIAKNANDAFVCKMDVHGALVWAKQFSSTASAVASGLDVDQFGNVYVGGSFSDSCDFDPGAGVANLVSAAGANGFVCKLTSQGNYVWAGMLNGPSTSTVYDVVDDNAGSIYLGGNFRDSVDFDPGPGVNYIYGKGIWDTFIGKFDTSGSLIWAHGIGGVSSELMNDLEADDFGNVYLAGFFNDSIDFDPGPGVYKLGAGAGADAFMLKLNSAGNFRWTKQISGATTVGCYAMATDPFGNFYATGRFGGTVDIDPGPGIQNFSSLANTDAYVLKLDSAGDFQWASQIEGNAAVDAFDMTVDVHGNVYSVGAFVGSADFDPDTSVVTMNSIGNRDIYVLKLDTAGKFLWSGSIGGTGNDWGYGIATDWYDNVYTTGMFADTADFDMSAGVQMLGSAGLADGFVHKFTFCKATYDTISPVGCYSFTSPSGKVWTTPGTYGDTISNQAGCDSILTIQLTIDSLDTSVTQVANKLTANDSNAAYQWIWCDSVAIAGDTNQSFWAGSPGYYAVIVTRNGCSDTSGCHFATVVSRSDEVEEKISLYPNPADDDLVVRIPANLVGERYMICSVFGQVLLSARIESREIEIPTSELAAGYYLFRIAGVTSHFTIRR